MISDRYDAADFLKAVAHCDLLRLQGVVEEELRVVDLTCRRAWNDGRSVPSTAPRYLNFLRRLSAWFDAGGEARMRLSPELRENWRVLVVRLVESGQLPPVALRSLGRRRSAASHRGPDRPFASNPPPASAHALATSRL
jgi:hypothetical protein